MVAGCDDANPSLIAQLQKLPHRPLPIHAILLSEGIHHILHQHVGWPEALHQPHVGLQKAIPAREDHGQLLKNMV